MHDACHGTMLELSQLLDAPRQHGTALGNWRWTVRQRLSSLREQLASEASHASDGWLAARQASVLRERNELMGRIAVFSPQVLSNPDIDDVSQMLRRLLADVSHHRQRLHDLVYDDVELELGGSE
ncbi:hypothetical protein [Nocardioides alcanivorans]|uniref:hypothetical protein n=1 Tax=Nocardioides alcanivorans TaxID=2897352 RepID=UPI001F41A773|nr:hypothetical protein [Nocardioides alcanivorans]